MGEVPSGDKPPSPVVELWVKNRRLIKQERLKQRQMRDKLKEHRDFITSSHNRVSPQNTSVTWEEFGAKQLPCGGVRAILIAEGHGEDTGQADEKHTSNNSNGMVGMGSANLCSCMLTAKSTLYGCMVWKTPEQLCVKPNQNPKPFTLEGQNGRVLVGQGQTQKSFAWKTLF